MDSFAKALEAIAGVMRDGAVSHPDNDWVRRTPEPYRPVPKTICGSCAKATSGKIISPTRPRAC